MGAAGRVRVVVVDDVDEVRRLVRTALRFRGPFAVVGEAATGLEAVEVVRDRQPELVVLDLGLPDLGRHDVLTRIRAAAPATKVVIFTGATLEDREWFTERAAGYVPKDRLDLLVETLEAAAAPQVGESATARFPCAMTSAAAARDHTRHLLTRWGLGWLIDDACVVVTELASNAVLHARSAFDLRIEVRATAHRDTREVRPTSPSVTPTVTPTVPSGAAASKATDEAADRAADRGAGDVSGATLRVEVYDSGVGTPEPRQHNTDLEAGRGLMIVSSLARSWGIATVGPDRKVVWAELASP